MMNSLVKNCLFVNTIERLKHGINNYWMKDINVWLKHGISDYWLKNVHIWMNHRINNDWMNDGINNNWTNNNRGLIVTSEFVF